MLSQIDWLVIVLSTSDFPQYGLLEMVSSSVTWSLTDESIFQPETSTLTKPTQKFLVADLRKIGVVVTHLTYGRWATAGITAILSQANNLGIHVVDAVWAFC